MQNDDHNTDTPDFAVLHGLSQSTSSIFRVYSDLKSKCKPAKLKGRMRAEETVDDFLLRVAISSSSSNGVLFRKAETADHALILVWMSLVKERAQNICLDQNIKYSSPITEDSLRQIATLNQNPANIKTIADHLISHHGIILIVEKHLPGMKLDGCVFKLSNGVPVVGISARYNRYDNFWFTLVHELSHIVLHYEKLDLPIIDDLDEALNNDTEIEANRLATNSLIPRNTLRKIFLNQGNLGRVVELSNEAECHPAIAAGMIRHKSGQWGLYSELVNFMDVRSELGIND